MPQIPFLNLYAVVFLGAFSLGTFTILKNDHCADT